VQHLALDQQALRRLDTLADYIFVRDDADGFLEGAAEIRLADASNCRKLAERDLL
jgi:hypothetical protein